MAYTVCVTWIAKPGEEDAVASCLEQLVEPSRAEEGVLVYIPNRDPEDPTKFFIYEQYVDEAAYTAHTETEHFKRLGFGDAIRACWSASASSTPPWRASRERSSSGSCSRSRTGSQVSARPGSLRARTTVTCAPSCPCSRAR